MKIFNYQQVILFCLGIIMSAGLMAQGRIGGTVTDDTGEALIGANIIVKGTTEGTITDFDGTFGFNTTQAFPLTVEVSFTGFNSQEIELASPTSDLSVSLTAGVLIGDDVVISASRKREKVQEAPASVSVLSARKLAGTAQATDPTRNLINVPGVQITQQSAARINIELRGGVGLFGTGAFPIKDYRSLIGPGIGTFDSNGAGINNVDLARIEVVRGAGSALYGPGVTTGVVHFITKNPIDYPGTTVEVIGGELATYGATVRHAGVNASKTFGYKVNASYKRGDEFTLDGSEGTTDGAGVFTSQFDKFSTEIVRPGVVNGRINPGAASTSLLSLDRRPDGNVMQDFWNSTSADLTLEFRPKDNLNITVAGGMNNASAVFYNDLGEGLSQFTEGWAQARMQAGGLFAQVFYVGNDGGSDDNPTFLYQSGNDAGIKRKQLEGQLQYNFDVPSFLDANFTTGVDYRQAISDTGNLVYGQNDEDDGYSVFGGYVQGKFKLGDKIDVIAAGRYDRFDFLGEGAFSPRAAIVYKADPKHTFRASYNHATFAPSGLQWNIDFPVNVIIPGVFDFWLAGMRDVQNFDANPMIEFVNQNFVAQGVAAATGLPIDLLTNLAGVLPDELPASGIGSTGLSNDFINQIASGALFGALNDNGLAALIPLAESVLANAPTGNNGLFFGVNGFDGSPLSATTPTIQGQIGSTKTYEVGYKGLFGDKLGASLDVYRITVNGGSDFTQIAPLVSLVGTDVSGFDAITGQLVQAFVGAGIPQESAVALATAYGGTANLIPAFYGTGAVETSGVPRDDGILHVPAGYRIFDSEYSRWGADLGLEYYASDAISLFANYSWLNATEFDVDQNDGSGQTFQTFLNTPKNKYRVGFNYITEFGWRGNMTFQHDDAFTSNNGQYSGLADEKNLVDAGIGYKFDNGLAIDLTAQNMFDNEYRAFPNMPKIGRRVLGKITYNFGTEGPSDLDGDGIADKKDACPNEAGIKAFQGCADSDGDGIPDKDDKCPLNAGDALYMGCPDGDGDGIIDIEDDCPEVSGTLNGCPDGDGDGVADKDDACPNDAGTLSGCPDGDGDGVADKDDACPSAAGTISGCPDGDGDGVADKDDKCPTVSARTADGCPADSDGDGVVGSADKCPNQGGIVDANGCPKDSDGDGVVDNDDKCPNIGGVVGPDGCAKAVPAAATEVFNRAIRGINFRSGNGVLTRESYAILDEVVSVMGQYPGLKLSIEGHTDSQGNDDKNMTLSNVRANSVMTFLAGKGVDATRMRAVGYGELVPIADNTTSAGRAENRRVAFKGSY